MRKQLSRSRLYVYVYTRESLCSSIDATVKSFSTSLAPVEKHFSVAAEVSYIKEIAILPNN